jgi:hypothetical protein
VPQVVQEKITNGRAKTRLVIIIAASTVMLLGLLVWILSQFHVDIVVTPISELSASDSIEPFASSDIDALPEPLPSAAPKIAKTSPLWNPQPQRPANPIAGKFRASNHTNYPVQRSSEATSNRSTPYRPPAHWDFAPLEGSHQGLILSLPEGQLQVQPGDVWVAFAQDGSQRYWGPYVVSETAEPAWNQRVQEWQLIVKP